MLIASMLVGAVAQSVLAWSLLALRREVRDLSRSESPVSSPEPKLTLNYVRAQEPSPPASQTQWVDLRSLH